MNDKAKSIGLISLYTLPNCAAADQTRAALEKGGIAFTERSAVDQSPLEAPVVTTIVSGHIVAWRGHQPDLIELLSDLVTDGPVPDRGLYDEESARNAVLTRQHALEQVDEHGVSTEDFLAECGDHPLYRGATVLDWLGY